MAWDLLNRAYTIGTIDGAQDITPGTAQTGFRDFSTMPNSDTTRIVAVQGASWAYMTVLKVGTVLRPQTYHDGSSGEGNSVTFSAGTISVFSDIGWQHLVYNDHNGVAQNAEGVLKSFSPETLVDLKTTTPLPATGKTICFLRGILAGDKKGAIYVWEPAEATAGDDFTYVVSALSATGRWVRQTTILQLPVLSADSDSYSGGTYKVGSEIRHKNASGIVKKIPISENYNQGSYATITALLAVASTQWANNDRVFVRGIANDGDLKVPMELFWNAADTDTSAALNVNKWRPADISGGNAGRWNISAPDPNIKFANSDATPDVSGGEVFTCADTVPAAITTFDGFRDGKRLIVRPGAQDQLFTHSSSFYFPGARDFTLRTTDAPISFEKENGVIRMMGGGGGSSQSHNIAPATLLTISSGSLTPIYGSHEIAGEGAAADDLLNIVLTAYPDGSVVFLRPTTGAYAITVKASGGNITTDTGVDISLSSVGDHLMAVKDGSTTRVSKISRDAPSAQTAADVANVTALKAIVTATGLSDGARINLLGYTSVGDGGGGVLTYIAASTATPDDFRVFKPNDVTLPAAGRFVRVAQAVYDWRQAGCVLDGSTDDAARANVAAADTAVAAITGGGKTMGLNYTSGGALVIGRDDLTVEDTTFLCLQPTSTTDNRVVRNNGDRNTFRRCSWDWGTAGIAVGHLSNDALFWNTGDDCTMDQCRATGDRKGTGFANNGGTNFRCIKPIIENLRYSSTPTATTAVTGVSGVNLTVSSITGFTNGARIFVLMNDGGYYETSINGAPSVSTIVMANAPTRSAVDTTGGLVVQPSTVDDSIQAIWNNAATAAYIERPVIRNITGDIGFGQYNRFTRGMAQGGCNGVDIVTPFVDNVDQAVDNTGSAANKGIRVIGGKIQNVRTWGIKHANSIIDCVVDDVLVENAGLACVVYSGPAESGLTVKTSRCTVANSILKNPGWGTYFGSDSHACVAILKSSFDLDFPKGIKVLGVRGVDDQAVTTTRYLFFSDVTQRAASGDDFNEMDEFCTFDYSGDGVSLNAENVSGAEAPVCSIYLTADQSIPDATWTEVLFTSEEYDPAQMHSTSSATGRIVIKRRGLYFVSGAIRFANNATGGRSIVLRHESANLYGGANQVAGHSTLSTYARASGYRYCEPGDELYMWAYQDSGGALNALTPETWLSAIRMPMNF